MSLQITRDQHGNVTITNPLTGKSETIATGVAGRPAEKTLTTESEELPAHMWGQLPSHMWGQLS
jgi:hypothetical protein